MITLTRRGLIAGALAVPSAMHNAAIAAAADLFYVDSVFGSDAADGRSPATAWKTVERISAGVYRNGTTILFRRGRTFPVSATLRLRSTTAVPRRRTDPPVVLGAYGPIGEEMPKLSSWKVLDPAGWSPHVSGIWRIDVNRALLSDGSNTQGRDGANVGRLLVDGAIKTAKKRNLSTLNKDWDFHSDGETFLYVRSDDDPKHRAAEIKASPNVRILAFDSSLSVRDLWFEGTGSNGANLVANSDVQWCVFHTIGGSFLGDGRRYGNGVEMFGGGSNVVVRNNLFWECYDVALTCQGFPMNTPNSGWDEIDFSDNWIARCAQAFEVWATFGPSRNAGICPEGSGYRNVQARRLHLFDIGRGASRVGRLDFPVWACFIETTPIETPYYPIPISVSEMRNCSDRLFFGPIPPEKPRSALDFVLEPSHLSLPAGSQIARGASYRAEQWDAFVARTGIGAGSTLAIEPAEQTGFSVAALMPFADLQAARAASRR